MTAPAHFKTEQEKQDQCKRHIVCIAGSKRPKILTIANTKRTETKMVAKNLAARLNELDRFAVRPGVKIVYPRLSPEDEAFFETMIGRSIAGDRNWSDAERSKYQDMLLGEYPGTQE